MSKQFDFDDMSESDDDVEEALKKVRRAGTHKKMVRRSTVAGATAVLLVAVSIATPSTLFKGSPGAPQIAAPASSTSTTALAEFRPALASEVIARAGDALDNVTGVSGTSTKVNSCVRTTDDGRCDASITTKRVVDFRFRSNGDAWTKVQEFDASGKPTEPFTIAFTSSGGESMSPGRAFGGLEYPTFGHFPLYTLLDGLSIDNNATLTSGTVGGRETWSIHAKGFPTDEFGFSPDEVRADFDKASLFPVQVVEMRQGKAYASYSVTNLQLSPRFTDADFADSPSNTTTSQSAESVSRSVDSEAALTALTSYTPLTAMELPDGFRKGPITFTADAGFSGAEGVNHHNRDVVVFNFNKGLRQVVMTTRERGPATHEWADPLSTEGDYRNAVSTKYLVSGGAYDGLQAELVTGFGLTPRVWVVGATTVTQISGDVSAEELKAMLASVERL